MHNNIMAAGSKERPPMLGPGRYSQWRSRFLRYIDTKPNGEGLRKSILSGPYVPSTVLVQAVAATEGVPAVQQHTTIETVLNMTPENKEHFLSEKEAIFLLLTGIGDEIYSTVDACKTANEMWIAIERLQQGESLNVQDVKTNLFWEFGKFTSRDGESMESYYSRFYKLMNELTRNNLQVTTMQVNVQFLQQLQPEWSRFVTVVKQSKEIDTISYHTLFDILKQYQNEVNDIRAERIAKSANPLALLAAAQPYSDNYYQAPKPQRSNATSSSTRPSASTRQNKTEDTTPRSCQSIQSGTLWYFKVTNVNPAMSTSNKIEEITGTLFSSAALSEVDVLGMVMVAAASDSSMVLAEWPELLYSLPPKSLRLRTWHPTMTVRLMTMDMEDTTMVADVAVADTTMVEDVAVMTTVVDVEDMTTVVDAEDMTMVVDPTTVVDMVVVAEDADTVAADVPTTEEDASVVPHLQKQLLTNKLKTDNHAWKHQG
ncbi:hypothetical protein Tco_0739604 [Tanacetum coccineum]